MNKVIVLGLLVLGFCAGCKDSDMAQWNSMGKRHKIELYSCGNKIGEWTSTGNVSNENHSDGYYFMDATTGKNIEISGTVIITQL